MDYMDEHLHDENVDLALDAELELLDWARAAGVSTEDLRQALRASLGPGLRKAA